MWQFNLRNSAQCNQCCIDMHYITAFNFVFTNNVLNYCNIVITRWYTCTYQPCICTSISKCNCCGEISISLGCKTLGSYNTVFCWSSYNLLIVKLQKQVLCQYLVIIHCKLPQSLYAILLCQVHSNVIKFMDLTS